MIKEPHKQLYTGVDLRCVWRTGPAVTGFALRTWHCTRHCVVLFHTFSNQQVFFEHLLCGRHSINLASVIHEHYICNGSLWK